MQIMISERQVRTTVKRQLMVPVVVLLAAFLVLGAVAAEADGTYLDSKKLTSDYSTGDLDLDQYLLYNIYSIYDLSKLPGTYKTLSLQQALPKLSGTVVWKYVTYHWDELSATTQAKILVYKKRPTGLSSTRTTTNFIIHYATSGDDAVDTSYVDLVETVCENVYTIIVTNMGYDPPPPDGTNGGDAKYDIYIASLEEGTLGVTKDESQYTGTPTRPRDYVTYFELDNGLGDPQIKTTLAHEFFHAVKARYDWLDAYPDYWFDEATSNWMMDICYPNEDDYIEYIDGPQYDWLSVPELTLEGHDLSEDQNTNKTLRWYGSSIFAFYLAKKYDNDVILEIWERLVPDTVEGIDGVVAELEAAAPGGRATTLDDALSDFCVWNYYTGTDVVDTTTYYTEGNEFGEIYISHTHNTYPVTPQTPSTRLPDHYGSNYIEFTPAEAGPGNLVLAFDGKDSADWKIKVVKVDPSGDDSVSEMTLDGDKKGSLTVNNFGSSSTYRKVALIATATSDSGDDNTYSYSAQVSSGEGDWTCMFYLNGDSGGEQATCDQFAALGVVGSSDDVNIVAQLDRSSSGYTGYGGWSGARRFKIEQGDDPSDTADQDLGATNMGSATSLSDFVAWGASAYPASRYCLVVWDREVDGFPTGTVITDSGSSDSLSFDELKTALATAETALGQDVDLVVLDGDMMGYLDVAYQVRTSVGFLVASQDELPSGGIPHDDVMTALKLASSSTASDLGVAYVSGFSTEHGASGSHCLSSLDLSQMSTVVTGFNSFVSELSTNIGQERTDYTGAWVGSERFGSSLSSMNREVVDLKDYCENLRSLTSVANLQTACSTLETALGSLVGSETHGDGLSEATGVSMYFPYAPADLDAGYTSVADLTDDTQWDEFHTTYFTDDTYEDNDTQGAAQSVTDGLKTRLSCYDEDWYSVSRSAGEGLAVYLTFTHNDRGNLDLYLYDTDGASLLDSSTSSTDDESLSQSSLGSTGTYYIKVVAPTSGDVNSYDMGIGNSLTMDSAATVDRTSIAVTFSENMDGSTVAASDFTVAGNTVSSVSVANNVVTLTVGTQLDTEDTPDVTLVADVADIRGMHLTSAGPLTPSDGIAPEVVSIDITSGRHVTVTFSETMGTGTLANTANYSQSGASGAQATANPSSVDISSNPVITLVYPYRTFVAGDNVTIAINTALADPSSNTLNVSFAQGSENPVNADTVAPTMPSASTASSTSVLVQFGEDLTDSSVEADGSDFQVEGGSYTVTAAVENSGVVTLTLSGGTPLAGDATPSVALVAEVTDAAGNPLSSAGPVTASDGILPGVSSVDVLSTTRVSVTFTETMGTSGLDTVTNYSQSGGEGAQATANPVSVDTSGNPEIVIEFPYQTFESDDNVTVTVSGVVDPNSNVINPSANSGSENPASGGTADFTAPTYDSAKTGDQAIGNSSAANTILLTFGENLDAATVSAADFQVSTPSVGVGDAQVSSATVTLTLVSDLDTEATPTITITGDGVADENGNYLTSGSQVATDGLSPDMASAVTATTTSVTVTFTEDLNDGTVASGDFSVVNNSSPVTISGMSETGGVVTLDLSSAIGVADTPQISLTNPVDDLSGNTLSTDGPITAADGIAPDVDSIDVTSTAWITVTYSETMAVGSGNAALDRVENYAVVINAAPSVNPASVDTSGNPGIKLVFASGTFAGTDSVTVTVSNVTDAGSNTLSVNSDTENPALDGGDDFDLPAFGTVTTGDSATGNSDTADRIYVVFDDTLDAATVSASDFQVTGRTVTAIESLAGATLKLVLNSALDRDDTPSVNITGDGVADDAGNVAVSDTMAAADGLNPTMDSASTTDRTHITVTFNEDLDETTLAASDFTVSGGFTIQNVTESSAGVVSIELTTQMDTDALPQVTLQNTVDDASGNTLGSAGPLTCSDGIAPEVDSIDVRSSTLVEVTFTETMGTSGLAGTGNYSQSGGTGAANPNSVDTTQNPTVKLWYTDGTFTVGDNITITVTGIQDSSGNSINLAANTGTENPVVADTTAPFIQSAATVSSISLQVTCNEDLQDSSVDVDGSDFSVDSGTYTVIAASEIGGIVTLTIDGGTPLEDSATPGVAIVDDVTDEVGNTQSSSGPVSAIDGIPPRVTAASIINSFTATLTFSETMGTGLGTVGNYSQSGATGASAQGNPGSVSTAGNPTVTLSYPSPTFLEGDIVTFTAANINDAAPSPNSINSSSDATETVTVLVDTGAPGMSSAVTTSTTTIDVTFDEDLLNSSVDSGGSDFQIDGAGATGASLSGSVVTLTATSAFARDATPTVSIVGEVSDLVGNPTTSGSVVASDGVSPPPVTSLAAAVADSSLDLTWTNPVEDFSGTVILRKESSTPTGVPSDGTTYSVSAVIGDGTVVFAASGDYSSTPFNDTDLTNTTGYYYAAYAYDTNHNYSDTADTASGTPADQTAPVFAGLAQAQDAGTSGTVILSWSQATEPVSPEGSPPVTYHTYRSTTSGFTPVHTAYPAGDLIYSATGVTTYQDTDLTNGQEYHYIVRAEDTLGNRDNNEVRLSVTPTDQVPPQITSGPTVASLGNDTATIEWQTDETSDSTVEYGFTSVYTGSTTETTMTTNHSVTLTGLQESSMYHFRVLSSDQYGNGPVASIDGTFYTNRSPLVTVTAPSAGAVWGDTQNITWSATDADGQTLTMTLQYSTDEENWSALPDPDDDGQAMADNDGTYALDTTAYPDGTSYYIRVGASDGLKTTLADPGGTISIENVQTIPMVTLEAPVGGEKWGQRRNITWETADPDAGESRIATVEYSTDNASWIQIITALADTGNYQWNTASVPDGTSYYIRVTVTDNRTPPPSGVVPGTDSDSSAAAFEIDNTPPEYVSELEITILPNDVVELEWEPSSSPDVERYNIYYDYGTGVVDYSTPYDWVPVGTTTWRSDSVAPKARIRLLGGQLYRYAVRAQDSAGNEEGNTSAQAVADSSKPQIQNLSVDDYESGKPRLAFKLTDDGSGVDISTIEVKLGAVGETAVVIPHTYNPNNQVVVASPTSRLSAGDYVVTVTAKDRAGNESDTLQSTFTVMASFDIQSVFSYPNPCHSDDEVTFRYTLTADADLVEVRIYDKADRLILAIPGDTDGDINETVWDKTYEDGDDVRYGTYIYKITATDYAGHRTEAMGKVTLLP